MKASQFFLMHKQAKRIQAIFYSRLADIAAIPMCQPGYYKSLKEDLKNEILGWDDPPEMTQEELLTANVERQWDTSAVETKNAMTAFFEAAKRVNGV
jgi:hypothetical protein